ncbi:hypothetical protein HA075_13825 [bacterium BFN5]|nr:hypothetical protein HA075_13825 [bacterium BFN5]
MCHWYKQANLLHPVDHARWIARSIIVFQGHHSHRVCWFHLSGLQMLTWWKVAGLLILFGVIFIQLIKVLALHHHTSV